MKYFIKYSLFFVFMLSSFWLQAQKAVILDATTFTTITDVSIYSIDYKYLTSSDRLGNFDIPKLDDNSKLLFEHATHQVDTISIKTIKDAGNIVFLFVKNEDIPEIIISVSKTKEKTSRIAEQVAVVSALDIAKVSPQTSADLLAATAGVHVQKSQMGGGSPVLRGMEANRVLLVVDGVRLNNAIYRSGHLQNSITVNPNTLQRVEVVFGPSSVIYGSDALGGVIHYITKKPKTNLKKELDGEIFTRFSSANSELTTNFNLISSFKKWAMYSSFAYSDFGDLRMGKNRIHGYDTWGLVTEYSNNSNSYYNPNPKINPDSNTQENTAYNQTDFLQKFYFPLKNNAALDVNFQYSISSNIPRFDKLTTYSGGSLKFAEWYYGPQKRLLFSPQLSIKPHKKWLDTGIITLAYQNISESRINRKFTSIKRTHREENVKVWSANADFAVPLALHRNLAYGAEITYNDVSSNAYAENLIISGNTITGVASQGVAQTRYPDNGSSYLSSAFYTNYRQDIDSKNTLNTGVRYSYTKLKARWNDQTFITLPYNDISLQNKAFTATASISNKISKKGKLSLALSSGFRSPNIDDIGKIREKNGKVTVPNVNLQPEYAYNAELGYTKHLQNRNYYFTAHVYYTLLDDYIIRKPFEFNGQNTIIYDGDIAATYANVNMKTAYIYGGTIQFVIMPYKNFQWLGDLTYTKGRSYDENLPLPSILPLFGSTSIKYKKGQLDLSLKFNFSAKKPLDEYDVVSGIDNEEQLPFNSITNTYYDLPAWNTLNFSGSYQVNRGIKIHFAIDNLFDKHYKEFASALSAPGRGVKLSVLMKI
jgi:hemoglobin/transferrin/lactoferrin receptor protein